ncbi:hypothetical protein AVEN_221291-1 [Araneus ventricosus]|uniref:Uncharacterized protein n=1 Tax=Araneus ventricosus TaxID=182803 RepID=A0A4Y2B1V3_ARAVE|nr:hypothetical protein AVEN_221291-1 [Araneus ventricosus]
MDDNRVGIQISEISRYALMRVLVKGRHYTHMHSSVDLGLEPTILLYQRRDSTTRPWHLAQEMPMSRFMFCGPGLITSGTMKEKIEVLSDRLHDKALSTHKVLIKDGVLV